MSNSVRALIIEDEETVRSILAAFLERYFESRDQTADVRTIGDAVQGLFELSTSGELYDIIMLDVRMPKLTGDEIYNSMEHVNPDILGRVMFVTAFPADLTERFPDRKLNILEKPFRYDTFSQHVERIVRR